MSVTVYGASDDLIEIEGDIKEEFNVNNGSHDASSLLSFSDGTVLRIEYTDSGVWRIKPIVRGAGKLDIEQASEADEDNYSDRATLAVSGRLIQWVVLGTHCSLASASKGSVAV